MPLRIAISFLLLGMLACSRGAEPQSTRFPMASPAAVTAPNLPDDEAGRLLGRAIDAAGGWANWMRHHDASFISTLTIFDPRGNSTSETIFLHKLLMHRGTRSRLESIGLDDELVFGLNGSDWWMLRSGQLVTDERMAAFVRFDGLSSNYWFQLPFVLAEAPGTLSYAGEDADGSKHWQKLRMEYGPEAAVPVNWIVVYVDVDTFLVDRVFFEVRADFLRQGLWRGEFDDYRAVDGIRRERRREFFPVNDIDRLLGTKAAEQIVEHVRYDNDFPAEFFVRPPIPDGTRSVT